jgi:hypothetical protein
MFVQRRMKGKLELVSRAGGVPRKTGLKFSLTKEAGIAGDACVRSFVREVFDEIDINHFYELD